MKVQIHYWVTNFECMTEWPHNSQQNITLKDIEKIMDKGLNVMIFQTKQKNKILAIDDMRFQQR